MTSPAWVHPTAVVDEGARLGVGVRVWHFCHVMAGAELGARVVLGQNCFVAGTVRVGDGCRIQNNVSLYDGVALEADVFCGPSAVFTNVLRPRAFVERKDEFQPTIVRRGATIGANATIVCGVELGAYCMIGAGAVVRRDVAAHALVVGAPARRIGWVSRSGERLDFDDAGAARCPRTGEAYRLDRGEHDARVAAIDEAAK